jgi:hypothetical protein
MIKPASVVKFQKKRTGKTKTVCMSLEEFRKPSCR